MGKEKKEKQLGGFIHRRKFLTSSTLGAGGLLLSSKLMAQSETPVAQSAAQEPSQAKVGNITKISAKYIIGYLEGNHVIYEDGCLVYQNDKVIYIGHDYQGHFDGHIDAKNSCVSPGFIDLNALGDIDHQLFAQDQDPSLRKYMSWHLDYFNRREEFMTPEEEAFKSYYAFAQLITNGITTIMPITSAICKRSADTYEEGVASLENAGRLGLRAYLGPSYISAQYTRDENGVRAISPMHEDGIKGFEQAVKFAKKYHNSYDGLVNMAFKPERIELQTEEILIETKKIADELNCPIKLHAAQGGSEYQRIQAQYGKSSIAYLDSIGFLGKSTLIPHAIYASGYDKIADKSDDDLHILKDTGTTVVHCPLVYSRGGTNLNSFARYRDFGIKLAMGTDTFPCDMIDNMRVGSSVSRHEAPGNPNSAYREFYNAATLGGAKALGREDIGRLCVGSKADIIIIDFNTFAIGQYDDPIKTMILQCTGRDVKTTIINGRTVMKNRIIPNFDYEENIHKAQLYYERMKDSYVERSLNRVTKKELFASSYRTIYKS